MALDNLYLADRACQPCALIIRRCLTERTRDANPELQVAARQEDQVCRERSKQEAP
jgi:hypothetical protein